MPIYALDDKMPVIDDSAYIHPSAEIIGDVIIEAHCYIAPQAVLRGDFGRIQIGHHSNVQDHCVLHSFPDKDCIVSPWGHIGHSAVLHGCVLETNVLVGMNAVIMDEVLISENCIIAASSLVPSGFKSSANQLILGSPAKVKRQLSDAEIDWKRKGTEEYVELAALYLNTIKEVARTALPKSPMPKQPSGASYAFKPKT